MTRAKHVDLIELSEEIQVQKTVSNMFTIYIMYVSTCDFRM